MKQPLLAIVALALVSQGGAAATTHATTQARPGYPTVGEVFVLNRDRADALPVKIQSTGDVVPVTLAGEPTVTVSPKAVVATRLVRQVWEYRQLVLKSADDPTAALNAAGNDGWEAVGSAASGTTVSWTLKRPR